MSGKENSPDSRSSVEKMQPSESEVVQLLKEAEQQYEECMRIADLADIAAQGRTEPTQVCVGQPDRTSSARTPECQVWLIFRVN